MVRVVECGERGDGVWWEGWWGVVGGVRCSGRGEVCDGGVEGCGRGGGVEECDGRDGGVWEG